MKVRCDHCRRRLGLLVHRYWHMRFCSAACLQDYQQRLHDETRAKIVWLDSDAGKQPPHPLFGSGADHGIARHFTG